MPTLGEWISLRKENIIDFASVLGAGGHRNRRHGEWDWTRWRERLLKETTGIRGHMCSDVETSAVEIP